MTNFSSSQAATQGFLLARREPATFMVWGGVALLITVLSTGVLQLMAGDQMLAIFEAMRAGTVATPEEMRALYAPVLPAYRISMIITFAGYSLLLPAIYRAVLGKPRTSPGYLRFSMDEVRQLAVMVVIAVIVIGIDLALGYGATLIGGAGGSSLASSLAAMVSLAATVFIFVRLSVAGPMTLDRGRISLKGSWDLTKGRFWPLLGVYALAFLFQVMLTAGAVIVMLLVIGLTALFANLGVIGVVLGMVLFVALLVFICLFYVLGLAVLSAPTAKIYLDLSSAPDDRAAGVA